MLANVCFPILYLLSDKSKQGRIFKSRPCFMCILNFPICKCAVCMLLVVFVLFNSRQNNFFNPMSCHIVFFFSFSLCCWVSTACELVSSLVMLPSSCSLTFTSWCEARPPCSACCLFTPIQGIHLRGYSSNKFTQQPLLSRDLSLPSPLACSFSLCLPLYLPLTPLFFLSILFCVCSLFFVSSPVFLAVPLVS